MLSDHNVLYQSYFFLSCPFYFIIESPRCTADDETSAHHTLHHLVGRGNTLHMVYEDVDGLLTHHVATLLHGSKLRVAGNGSLAIGEAANADVLRDAEPHTFSRIEDAYGRIVVDGKEGIGAIRAVLDFRRYHLCLAPFVADKV